MKNTTISAVMAAAILLTGCGKQSPGGSGTPTPASGGAASSATPVSQPALTAWQQGDKAAAVTNFLAADWSAHPLFAADSPLSLSEKQFVALSDADRQVKSATMMPQLDSIKQLAAAVIQTGTDAAAKGDTAQARKCFTALKQCGTALSGPDSLAMVQLVGKALTKKADAELAKIGP